MTRSATPVKPRTPLTRAQIVAAAITIADTQGLAAVSMRSVGRALGVEAMSLYHHVANKDAMLDAMVDVVFTEFHEPVPGRNWENEIRQRSHSARVALKRHPWGVGLMDSRRNAGPANLAHHDAMLGCLRAAGFPLRLAGHAFALLDSYLYGFLVQEVSLPVEGAQGYAELGAELFGSLPDGALPHLVEYATTVVMQPGYDFGDEFDVGLDLILEGLSRRLASTSL